MGYEWPLLTQQYEHKDTLHIPGCALADDMLLISDKPDGFFRMVREFSDFLTAVGLSFNPVKCHYTTSGVHSR